jgi:hypothetical protein
LPSKGSATASEGVVGETAQAMKRSDSIKRDAPIVESNVS